MTGSDKHVRKAGLSDAVKEGSDKASDDVPESMSRRIRKILQGRMIRRVVSKRRSNSRINDQWPLTWEFKSLLTPDNPTKQDAQRRMNKSDK